MIRDVCSGQKSTRSRIRITGRNNNWFADLSGRVHEEPAVCDDLQHRDAGSVGLVQRLSGRLKGQSSEIEGTESTVLCSVSFVFGIAQYNKSTPLTSRSRSDVLNTKAKDPDPYRTYLAVSDMDSYL
jgi:hypothetical protein